MIDIDIIKQKYSQMTDEELMFLAKADGNEITHEAFIALKREFRKRGLHFEDIEESRTAVKKQEILGNLEKESELISDKLWSHVFELSYTGKSDNEIYQFLTDEGFSPELAHQIIESLETVVKKVIAKIEKHIISCKLSFACGCLLLFINYYSSISFQLYIVGIILSFVSAIRWADNDKLRNKFKTILENVQET